MKLLEGGITAPTGFLANGIACGIKKRKKDLALVVSEQPCSFAGSFTTNLVKAAPVDWDMAVVKEQDSVRALVVNSGNANACTGVQGMLDTRQMATLVAETLSRKGFSAKAEEVLVCSTGVIGVPLPMETVKEGITLCAKDLQASRQAGLDAAQAICTTDTFTKEVAVEVALGEKTVRIGGMAKGSGMIHPNMATMLSFITTDAAISKKSLQGLLGESVIDSYNMISVDGDTSTNDTVLVLANGMSNAPSVDETSPYWESFKEAFLFVHTALAKAIVRDGEGAGKFIEVTVKGALDKASAQALARSVVSSNLVKAAFFGSDANWGRILCAMGYSGAQFDPKGVKLSFRSGKGSIVVLSDGQPIPFDEKMAKTILLEREVEVLAELCEGSGEGTAWGCDLSYEYVRINGDYRS
ncbi:bifunctional ornithine acetyltransferase/N-acetylglutamate synthase [Sphaerochaeta sp. PS]|uniref:bifunctional ornithine acetyltransferase/N-acetylglutamate synthase n=1 Tax=Sphaerochaeta sp. PS TaxID=3076336 RepID=UPI0028A4C4C8|nr:bifunctional ornithine acetyltransferase/N-acetylglutamate synthase [Sphaerochaeta sp. PS]MDT4762682.1 bifunctional ornithine acetyltransferase/N-acetylglutamate synthase [Sphaerochaeta sp. PS]